MIGPDPYTPRSGDDSYDVVSYDLDLRYRVRTNRLEGRAVVNAVAAERLRAARLDLVGLRASRVRVDGDPRTRFAQDAASLRVTLPRVVEPGEEFSIEVRYAGAPGPRRSTWGAIGWEELEDGVLVASQPIGAPTWFPCNDRPDDRARYRIAVTTDDDYAVAATGVARPPVREGGLTRWEFVSGVPTATYLAAVHIGPYRESAIGRARLLAPPQLASAARRWFADVPRMLETFEQAFGPYPQEHCTIVVTPDELEIPLEAQGLAVFGANHFVPEAERLVPHELAHQWFGNSVGVEKWRDIWLNEGFACFAEWVWSEASGGPGIAALADRHHARLRALPQDLVISEPGPRLMFDDRVYKRGALTLEALRRTLGGDAFGALLRAWVQQHRHGLTTTDSFRELVGRTGGADATALLSEWLDKAPLPELPAPSSSP
ncbi:M1 family metallopeptidase [Microbacterium sp. M3]|uniref:Aminopeptidase N n=1 Tax=Microbacterium arthrosphaerae TaxID=792652 RepID=A0ABU4GWP2_9MICO|nr:MULTISPECIES: M1 family metallopeptidase [Microbacterium]MDW4571488.1 M1 family metallopeptidase [Microbacterium arthrosphaerae]MDW7605343.1 M1 family metallopeptidase [Microbacterium sp. M3]